MGVLLIVLILYLCFINESLLHANGNGYEPQLATSNKSPKSEFLLENPVSVSSEFKVLVKVNLCV